MLVYHEKDMEHKLEFINECKELVSKVEKAEISIEDACYAIAGKMADDAFRNDLELIGVMEEAGELELPPHQVSGDRDARWEALKEKIKDL